MLQIPCFTTTYPSAYLPSLSRVSPTSPLYIAPVRPLAYHLSLPLRTHKLKVFMIFITNVILITYIVIYFTYNKDMKEMIIFLKNNIIELQHIRELARKLS